MENKVSSSNPNIKNVTVPSAKKPVNEQEPKLVPVKAPDNRHEKPAGSKNPRTLNQQKPQEKPEISEKPEKAEPAKEQPKEPKSPVEEQVSAIEKIREDTEKHVDKDIKKAKETEEKKKEESKEKEKIRIVIRDAKPPMAARILQGFMRVICLLLIIAVCSIGIPRLFGINEFNVLTGSMTPTYPVGTLVFVQPKDPSTIRPGEVVTMIMDEDLNMVTHRVTANNYEDKTLVTKGDANNSEDAPSLYENVVGVVVFSIPYAGGIVDYMTNDANGRVFGIGIVLSILALTFIAEGICYVLTKQSASVYNKNDKKDAAKGEGDGKGKYDIRTVNARKVNKEFKRGKGTPVKSVPPRDSEEEKGKEKKKPEEDKTRKNE